VSATFDQVRSVVSEAIRAFSGTALESDLKSLAVRLDGPLRVAVAGRVKAGKSTLLNALVGERLAPTDAGECTKIVTWYREGIGYEVEAELHNGEHRPLRFDRREGAALNVDLGDLAAEEVERLHINWPAASLRDITLIDTPGLASINDENSLRTHEFLAAGSIAPDSADAVIYLMRHLHRRDVEFLGTFLDRTTSGSSPVNSIGVLSRADEVGACRPDALESAKRIAARYQNDPVVSTLCSEVLPVAGLIAESGQTMREAEGQLIRQLAASDQATTETLLRSADDFCDPNLSSLTVENRRELILRFGLFGMRMLVDLVQKDQVRTAGEMASVLVAASGLTELQRAIRERFLPRARLLKAKNALAALAAMSEAMTAAGPEEARRLQAEVERIEAGATEFQELRLEHLVRSGTVRLQPGEVDEVLRMLDDRRRPQPESDDSMRIVALNGIERWRIRGADPLADPALREAAETMARRYEAIYVAASSQT
jgi:hypothetical protein